MNIEIVVSHRQNGGGKLRAAGLVESENREEMGAKGKVI